MAEEHVGENYGGLMSSEGCHTEGCRSLAEGDGAGQIVEDKGGGHPLPTSMMKAGSENRISLHERGGSPQNTVVAAGGHSIDDVLALRDAGAAGAVPDGLLHRKIERSILAGPAKIGDGKWRKEMEEDGLFRDCRPRPQLTCGSAQQKRLGSGFLIICCALARTQY